MPAMASAPAPLACSGKCDLRRAWPEGVQDLVAVRRGREGNLGGAGAQQGVHERPPARWRAGSPSTPDLARRDRCSPPASGDQPREHGSQVRMPWRTEAELRLQRAGDFIDLGELPSFAAAARVVIGGAHVPMPMPCLCRSLSACCRCRHGLRSCTAKPARRRGQAEELRLSRHVLHLPGSADLARVSTSVCLRRPIG